MVLSKNDLRKIEKKQKRAQHSVTEQTGIRCTSEPTNCLVVCNAGLSTGLQLEDLLREATQHASVDDCCMLPDKSYCFLQLANAVDAERIYDALHGRCALGQNGTVLYLSFCERCPQSTDARFVGPLPDGLVVLDDFIDERHESELLRLFADTTAAALKHRSVQHFGYEFRYGSNDVDRTRPLLDRPIPVECVVLWRRLRDRLSGNEPSFEPDQLTVNVYEPGQGIPAHVDTHSPFGDTIVSLSLGDAVSMEFRRAERQRSVWLPARSLLLMRGESRYGWTHGITPRLFDCRPSTGGGLSVRRRSGRRVSLTFRTLRADTAPPVCRCAFAALCDSAQNEATPVNAELLSAVEMERRNVHSVYDTIAGHFSETRHSPWPQVVQFIDGLGAGAVLVDVGCGNGKYLHNRRVNRPEQPMLLLGCDRSGGLLDVCRERELNVWRCDCLNVPLRDGCADGCICIAVVHHLATEERRLQAIREMARILRPGGQALVYVWAKNQAKDSKKSTYLLQNRKESDHASSAGGQQQYVNGLPVHTNRTQFVAQDMLVPWKLKSSSAVREPSGEYLRYYHVFEEGELEALVGRVRDIFVVRSYYDQGNWCVIFERNQQ